MTPNAGGGQGRQTLSRILHLGGRQPEEGPSRLPGGPSDDRGSQADRFHRLPRSARAGRPQQEFPRLRGRQFHGQPPLHAVPLPGPQRAVLDRYIRHRLCPASSWDLSCRRVRKEAHCFTGPQRSPTGLDMHPMVGLRGRPSGSKELVLDAAVTLGPRDRLVGVESRRARTRRTMPAPPRRSRRSPRRPSPRRAERA